MASAGRISAVLKWSGVLGATTQEIGSLADEDFLAEEAHSGRPMNYSENADALAGFYAAQCEIARQIARRPLAVRAWLATVRVPRRSCEPVSDVSAGWRCSRLSSRRHREIRARLTQVERGSEGASAALGDWLVRSLPAALLIDISGFSADPALEALGQELLRTRESIFGANYGLARVAAGQGRPENFDDRLSASSCGLLDAIDRYVPGEGSARFGFFATYWIRYHLSRQIQKCGAVVSYPIHQQRQDRRAGLERPDRPQEISFQAVAEEGPDGERSVEYLLCDDGPAPYSALDSGEIASRLTAWLRTSVPPATRVMLAATHSLCPLPEAACDYLIHLREIARERLRFSPS